MKKAFLMAILVLGVAASAFASCYQADCDESKRPGSCDRARAAYDACVQREESARADRERREQERREAAEREALRKYEEVNKAVRMKNPGY